MAVMTTCNGIFTKLLISSGIVAPAFQMLCVYAGLSLVYSTVLAFRPRKLHLNHWGKYSLLSLSDSQANFLIRNGYHLTSIVSVMTLFNSSVIIVMILSIIFLHKKYNSFQYFGTITSFIGIVCIIMSHSQKTGLKWGGDLSGDAVVLTGTLFFCM